MIIFRATRRLPDGTILVARDYNLKAWPIEVPDEDEKQKATNEKDRQLTIFNEV